MKLQEAIKLLELFNGWCKSDKPFNHKEGYIPPQSVAKALDTLIAHAKQPVQVTDEMVEAATKNYMALALAPCENASENCWNIERSRIKAALQAALGVKHGTE